MYMLRLSGRREVEVTPRGTSNSPWTGKYSSASRGQEYRCSWLRHEHGDIEVCVHRYQTPLPVPITWSQELSALSGVMDGSRAHFVLLIINLGLSEYANQRGVLRYARARVVERIPWWYFDLAVGSQRMAVPESISEVCAGSETWLRGESGGSLICTRFLSIFYGTLSKLKRGLGTTYALWKWSRTSSWHVCTS